MRLLRIPRLRAYLGLAVLAAGLAGLAVSGDLLVHAAKLTAFYVLAAAGFAILSTAATSLPLRTAVVVAVVLRVAFLPGMPSLSDDYQRYVWDGRVQLAGINPYRYLPTDHALDGVPFSGRDSINHEQLRTIYPPLTEAVFAAVAAAARAVGQGTAAEPPGAGTAAADRPGPAPHLEVVLLKLVFGSLDLATAAAIWSLSAKRRRHWATVLYLLCPAVIVQVWEAAHAETAATLLCVVAALLLVRRRDAWAGFALGLAVAFKVTPAGLLLPALLGGRASPVRLLAGFAPALALPYVPYLLTGGWSGSLFQSGTEWTGGSLLFAVLARLSTPETARWLALAVFITGAVWIARRTRGRERTAEAFAWTFMLLVFCLPVVHAWYWIPPLALGLAGGLWLPLVIGLVAPLPLALGHVHLRAGSLATVGGQSALPRRGRPCPASSTPRVVRGQDPRHT